jgi:hypothetical protein
MRTLKEPVAFTGRLHRMISLGLSIDEDDKEEALPDLDTTDTGGNPGELN